MNKEKELKILELVELVSAAKEDVNKVRICQDDTVQEQINSIV